MSIETITNRLKELFSKKSALKSKLTEQIENNKTEILPNYVQLILENSQQHLNSDKKLKQNIQKMIKNHHSIEPRKIIVVDIR
ncbi:hypothetical protein ACI2IV_12845 [Psychrobacter faecalis]